jgi:transcriptional regulator with XRE-family HTH domain
MPRRTQPDPLSLKIGLRIAQFLKELNLTLEELGQLTSDHTDDDDAFGNSKGHLSNLERGLVRPTVSTLKRLADSMGIALVDLVIFPEEDLRQKLIDRTRGLTAGSLRKLLKELDTNPKPLKPAHPAPRKARHRVTKKRKAV